MPLLMRDLIEVPVAKTVVRLTDAKDTQTCAELAREFVLTRDVEKNLRAIAGSIKEGQGRGFFLVGPYGSGKSHFLSYISLILSGEVELDGDNCPLKRASDGHRLLAIRLSLVNVRGETRLEEAFLQEAQETILAKGGKISLTKRARFLDYVESSLRPIDPAGLDNYLASINLPSWQEIRKDEGRAVAAAWGWIKLLGDCPAMPNIPPDKLIADLLGMAKEIGFDGIIVVIDELSEFLRSKPSPESLSEDARYLQLIGEVARTEKIWIVASLQEAIEQTGDIAREVLGKIKDRYPIRLTFDEQHIRDLIDGRLVRKKTGSRESIRNIWRHFSECVPNFKIDFESFHRIYPMHPATIRYLESLSPLLSAHRGMVDFIVTSIRGDVKRDNAGLLNGEADRLVTVEMIYSHFRDRIRGDDRFSDYDSLVRKDFHRAVDKILQDKSDRQIAYSAGDVLILNEIAALEKPKTVSELAAILLSAVTGVSIEANEQYLAEVILAPLLKECLFLRLEQPEAAAGGRIFRLTLERDRRGLFEKELERMIAGIKPNDTRIFRAIFENVPTALPIREIMKGSVHDTNVLWRGTQRKGLIFWAESMSQDLAEENIDKGDLDFGIAISPPDFVPITQAEKSADRIISWLPRFDDAGLAVMRAYYATLLIASSASVEHSIKQEAVKKLEDGREAITRLIESAYKQGAFIHAGNKIECGQAGFAAGTGFVERSITEPVILMLKKIHPKFLEIAPEVEFVSRRALSPLVEAILTPGKISMAAAKKNNTRMMIEGVLIAMGIATVSGPSFVMRVDTQFSSLVRYTMDAIGDGIKTAALVSNLRRGVWGMSRELIELLLAAIVHSGMAGLKRDGRKIPSAIVGLSHIEESDEIQAGELLDGNLRKKLFDDPVLSEGMNPGTFSMVEQRMAWERLIELKNCLKHHAEETLPKLAAVSEYPVFDSFDFEKVHSAIERGISATACVDETSGASKGLAKYLSSDQIDMQVVVKLASSSLIFVNEHADKVVRIADYAGAISPDPVMPPHIADALMEVKDGLKHLNEIVLAEKMDALFASFDRFISDYIAWYSEEHRLTFSRERFAPYDSFRASKEFGALVAAGRISGIHLVDSAKSIDRSIDSILAKRCERAPSAELRLKARCSCGFIPGNVQNLEDIGILKSSILAGIKEAGSVLSEPKILERLTAHISALRDIDINKAARLESVFHVLKDGLTIERFISVMTPEAALLLDEALHRKVSIVSRNAKALFERLTGRRLPPKKLREIFDQWLGVQGDGEVLIDMSSDENRTDSSAFESLLVQWTRDHNLDESGAKINLVISPETMASSEHVNGCLDSNRLGTMAALVGLSAAGTDDCIALLSAERRFEQFAWEIARKLAGNLADGFWPKDDANIKCNFVDVAIWCESLIEAVRPFRNEELFAVIGNESGRDKAMSFIEEHHSRHDFPHAQCMNRLRNLFTRAADARNQIFSDIPQFNTNFKNLCAEHSDCIFIFLDAARWDLVSQLDPLIQRLSGFSLATKQWLRVRGASTAAWQEAFFGTDDLDSIISMMRREKVSYFGSVERADVRKRVREDDDGKTTWLNFAGIDRIIHTGQLPLHRIFSEAEKEITEAIIDLKSVIAKRHFFAVVTDHGFSEMPRAGNNARFCHDGSQISDTIASIFVYERI